MSLFSIIIPTFNSEKHIAQCLDSLVVQTFKDFEVVIVDGNSQDSTLKLLKAYESRLRLLASSEVDRGVYDAMNKGVKMAQGQWIIFLGSDDSLYSETTLEQVKGSLDDCHVVYGNVSSAALGGIYDGEFTIDKIRSQNICHQAIFFRKEVFKMIGNFDLRYKVFSDWDHNLRWFLSSKIKHKYINIVVSNFSPGGMSSRMEDDFENVKDWTYSKLIRNSYNRREKLQILKIQMAKALEQARYKDLISIIMDSPMFFLNGRK